MYTLSTTDSEKNNNFIIKVAPKEQKVDDKVTIDLHYIFSILAGKSNYNIVSYRMLDFQSELISLLYCSAI
jgi:hypothetical protein